MDFDKASQTSREGFADILALARKLTAEADPEQRADQDQCVAAIRSTFDANQVPINADTTWALVMGIALLVAELQQHHPNLERYLPCFDAHDDRVSMAAVAFHDQQDGHR